MKRLLRTLDPLWVTQIRKRYKRKIVNADQPSGTAANGDAHGSQGGLEPRQGYWRKNTKKGTYVCPIMSYIG
ncbi:hypothetical protein CU048_00045 [Beijerinckiaceae bacterium]|nr:hypothetical protein CU048_00045 [Beijerinckiaceae bacterium]